jgi:hypothetical protein
MRRRKVSVSVKRTYAYADPLIAAVNEGLYSSIFHGILIGFLFPLLPWFFFREIPSANFFDPLEGPDAPLSPLDEPGSQLVDEDRAAPDPAINHESQAEPTNAASMFGLRGMPGGDWRTGVVFGQRTQVSRTLSIGAIPMLTLSDVRWRS